MKKLILFIALSVLSITIGAAAQENCSKEKTEAIIEYLRVNSIDDLMDQMLIEIQKQIPPEHREVFAKIWKSAFDTKELKEMILKSMCKIFTIEEIQALTKFYNSPEGRSVMKKIPQYMTELMPYLQVINQRAMQKAIEEINKTQNKEKLKPEKSL
ncbi:MAG: hypothetical protein A2W19_08455 [Spirochaetes bacterium RBG_16_49_21]|nr:MAG: hypothetical protein A2W19_08455 [Spirochaetes bacterium RBG_16_49_21]